MDLLLIELLVGRGSVFVDVGANTGIYSRMALLQGASVVAIEPVARLAMLLLREFPPGTDVRRLAIAEQSGEAVLVTPVIEGVAFATRSTLSGLAGDSSITETVPTARLDDVVQSCHFVKIDVEGHELVVLRSAERLLLSCRPMLLVEIEWSRDQEQASDTHKFLAGIGYRSFYRDPESGRLVQVTAHEAALLQISVDAPLPGQRKSREFVNNFLFLHGESEAYKSWLSGQR